MFSINKNKNTMQAHIAITFNDNEKAYNTMNTEFYGSFTSETSNEWEMGNDDTYALYFYAYNFDEHTLYLQYGMKLSDNYEFESESESVKNVMIKTIKNTFGKDNINDIEYGDFWV